MMKPASSRRSPGGQQVEGADGGGKDPAPVDVGHQEHRGPGLFGHAEVDQVVFL